MPHNGWNVGAGVNVVWHHGMVKLFANLACMCVLQVWVAVENSFFPHMNRMWGWCVDNGVKCGWGSSYVGRSTRDWEGWVEWSGV